MGQRSAISRNLRPAIASAAVLVAAVGVLSFGWDLLATRALAAAALAGSALLLHKRTLGPQLLVRGLWASALLLSGIDVLMGWRSELVSASVVVAGTATALLSLGRRGLENDVPAGSFAPVAFRGSLVVAMAMALADAQSLLFYGLAWLESNNRPTMALLLAMLVATGVVGLYRLRVWGLLLATLGAATVGVSALAGVLEVPAPVQTLLAITSAIQLVALTPLVRAVLRGPRASTRSSRCETGPGGVRIEADVARVEALDAGPSADAETPELDEGGHEPSRAARTLASS